MSYEINYDLVLAQAKNLVDKNLPFYSNLANISALIMESMPNLNWAGFYLKENDVLFLGPFQGRPACTKITFDRGVCGYSATTKKTVVVPDVHEFPGHIACDSASQSEIVVPLIINDSIYGVLDLDAPIINRFSQADKTFLENLVTNILLPCLI
ncbi:MAG: GAF domain-containing protein [Fusobacteriaceae bacterium]|jgi:GAF domain-containing protein|nr:GAF domain-containing protein [Fusobacteriaceae bacterium]